MPDSDKRSLWQRVFARDAADRAKLLQLLRRLLFWVSAAYLIGLLALCCLLKFVGERNWILGSLLYLPAGIALVPYVLLTPICLLLRKRVCWLHLLAVLLLFCFFHRPHFSSRKTSQRTIRVVTNNVGQRHPQSMLPFINAQSPDIIAFQEASNRQPLLRAQFPDKFVAVHDEFAVVSRWPIKHVGYVPGVFSHYGYAAVWFELERDGKPLMVYNVHLPTPRRDFNKLRGPGFRASLVRAGGIFSSSVRAEYKTAMESRVEAARKLINILKQEKRPMLIMGDFNMSDCGYTYGLFRDEFQDAFALAGNGYGLTFPGLTRNPLSLFGPWLRLDYIFIGKDWRPLHTKVEPRQNAQHLAVAAELELIEQK